MAPLTGYLVDDWAISQHGNTLPLNQYFQLFCCSKTLHKRESHSWNPTVSLAVKSGGLGTLGSGTDQRTQQDQGAEFL